MRGGLLILFFFILLLLLHCGASLISHTISVIHKLFAHISVSHADDGEITVGAHATRCGWGSNGAVEVGKGSVRSVPKNMQWMARCP